MVFHKNHNTQMQVYTTQHLSLEIGETFEACSIVQWEGTHRKP